MARNGAIELPAYIQLRYEERGIFARLKNDIADVTSVAGRDFQTLSGVIDKSLTGAISAQRTAFGSLDLGLDDMRKAITLQNARTAAAEEYARAARAASNADAGMSRELRLAAEAAEALAAKEHEAAAAAQVHAGVLGKVQAELNREAGAAEAAATANHHLRAANDNAARSAGSHRFAMIGLGQQMQDAVIQAQMGTSALTIFAQQGSQAAFQMAGMGGAVGRVASVMAGPWGAAVFAGTALLGPLISGLINTSEAMDDVKFATDSMKDAQGILGDVVDLTTGKLSTQRAELIALARAQLIVARLQSQERETAARSTVTSSTKPSWYIGGGPVGLDIGRRTGIEAQVGRDFTAGRINTDDAVRQLELLRNEGKITTEQFTELASAYANLGVELANQKVYQEGLALLDGKGGKSLLKPAKAKKGSGTDKAAKEAERLARFGDNAAEAIARLNDKFDASPKFIDQAAQATRELDALIKDLEKRKPIGFEGMIEDAKTAKQTVIDALVRPVEDLEKASERRVAIQDLLAQGRDDEAAALQQVYALEEKLGSEEDLRAKVAALTADGRKVEAAALQALLDKYPELKRRAAEVAEIEAKRTREAERQKALFEAQIAVLDTARSDLTSLLSGRKADLFGDLKQSLKDLQGARLADQLFGGVFQEIEDQLRQRSPLGRATSRLTTSVDEASTGADHLATATETAAQRILAAANAIAANDNGYIDAGTGDIVVTRNKAEAVGLKRPSIVELADMTAHGIVDPLLAGFDDILGTKFFGNLSATLSGVVAGQLVGGTVGSVLGGLRGLAFDFGPDLFGKGATDKILGKFDKALGGVQTGTQSAGIMKALGIKTSTTGAQIGGAIGSLIPIPGMDILGSIAGGLLGGLFKKTKWARVLLSSSGSTLQSNSGKYEDAVTQAGDSFNESLQNIADQFGGSVGDYGQITLGVRHGDWRVNTGGTSLKIKKGATEFDKDQEAAMKYALETAIDRGAIQGIRNSTQRLLKAGDDLDKALQNALDWENVFRELKQYRDPLGSALDDLDTQFEKLIDLAMQAGASTEEWADLQELYGIKQAEIIKDTQERVIDSLQSLLDDLTIGDSGLSLRSREQNALARYQPLADRVASGDTTAYDDYATAAQELLDIERQLYGSQQQYFDRLNEVTDLTKSRIDAETNVVSIAENRDSPFDSAGTVRSSIDQQTETLSAQLTAANQNYGTMIALLSQIAANGGGSAAGASRFPFIQNF
ncbi:phage tail length tape measure family protein [Novosphingobium mathurense]|uniref:Prophage tail length tape measure protein n=1 Tax=Novosphingobium mathurense TaxID=428990 RepID=A0A1U6GTM8_9SPHN|nr:phage tail length tape measure family protein [Novosphingobium mathurense]SLJ86885.1 Prophage tail length tape measure protein [Novosphingobium mathurense]